jgi:hypothetical protein
MYFVIMTDFVSELHGFLWMSDLSYGSLYREGLLMATVKELPKYTLNLVGVQEVRWDRNYTKPAKIYTF